MDTPILSSTFLLTLLLMVGLFFFIRASVKDRTEELKFVAPQTQETIFERMQQHFSQRAYHVAAVDPETNQVIFEGFVRPSWFLAIFLTLLAVVGNLCLALVLSMLFAQQGSLFLGLVLLSPLAGFFYWKQAGRIEQVSLKVEPAGERETTLPQNLITITGHRDELAVLRQVLQFSVSD